MSARTDETGPSASLGHGFTQDDRAIQSDSAIPVGALSEKGHIVALRILDVCLDGRAATGLRGAQKFLFFRPFPAKFGHFRPFKGNLLPGATVLKICEFPIIAVDFAPRARLWEEVPEKACILRDVTMRIYVRVPGY